MYAKVRRLVRLGQFDEALSTTALLLARYGDAVERNVRVWVAWALVSRAKTLLDRKKYRSALRALDDALARSFDSTDSDLREVAAIALAYKIGALAKVFRLRASVKTAELLHEYIGADPDPQVLDAELHLMSSGKREMFLRSLRWFHEADQEIRDIEGR
jgi:tetratricopeptide (TPR) repeat protein